MIEKLVPQLRYLHDKSFFMVDDMYIDILANRCGPYASLVYFALCRHASKEQHCFPSISTISKKLDISTRQVKRALKILENYRIIKIDRSAGKNNVYYLLDKKEWLTEDGLTSDSQSPVPDSHLTSDSQSPEPVTHSHPKEIHIRKYKKDNVTDLHQTSFDHFYSAYPKHEGREKALTAWRKLDPSENLVTTILRAIEKQKTYKAHLKTTNQFCPEWPMPVTWLNGRRWEDEVPEINSQQEKRLAY